MIKYRVAFIGDEKEAYKKAQDFFSKNNIDINIELVDISDYKEIDIKSMHFHSAIYNMNEIKENKSKNALKFLLQSKAEMSDLVLFPLTKSEVVKDDKEIENKYLMELSGKNENPNAIPINVSQEENMNSVFEAIQTRASGYQSLAENAIDSHQQSFEQTSKKLLDAMEKKSPYTASHFRQVGTYSEAIANFMGKDSQEVTKTKSIAILHDAGKLLMPKELLDNPHMTIGRERKQMELHASLGEAVIPQDLFDFEERGGIIEHHDSTTDNKYARIIAVADCIDTMSSQRAYNNPKAIQEVFRDLARNIYPQPKKDEDGNIIKNDKGEIVYNHPQFGKEEAKMAIIMLANELGSIGYDIKAMLKETENNWNIEQDKDIFQYLDEYSDKITINENAKEGAYTSLGFRLSETGHLEFENRPAAVLSRETRIRSEYEFQLWKNSTKEQKRKVNDLKGGQGILEAEEFFSPEELESFKLLAENRVNEEDEKGRAAVKAGRVISRNELENEGDSKKITEQMAEAAIVDESFNIESVKSAYEFFENVRVAENQKENEERY